MWSLSGSGEQSRPAPCESHPGFGDLYRVKRATIGEQLPALGQRPPQG